MTFDWQTASVAAVILAACIYLARAAWQTVARKRAAACGSCSACPADSPPTEPEVISVGQLIDKPAANGKNHGEKRKRGHH